ncbi:hypothetical protein RUND412_003992 [Rhizina undulata]
MVDPVAYELLIIKKMSPDTPTLANNWTTIHTTCFPIDAGSLPSKVDDGGRHVLLLCHMCPQVLDHLQLAIQEKNRKLAEVGGNSVWVIVDIEIETNSDGYPACSGTEEFSVVLKKVDFKKAATTLGGQVQYNLQYAMEKAPPSSFPQVPDIEINRTGGPAVGSEGLANAYSSIRSLPGSSSNMHRSSLSVPPQFPTYQGSPISNSRLSSSMFNVPSTPRLIATPQPAPLGVRRNVPSPVKFPELTRPNAHQSHEHVLPSQILESYDSQVANDSSASGSVQNRVRSGPRPSILSLEEKKLVTSRGNRLLVMMEGIFDPIKLELALLKYGLANFKYFPGENYTIAEFTTPAGFQAAMKASPISVAEVLVFLQEIPDLPQDFVNQRSLSGTANISDSGDNGLLRVSAADEFTGGGSFVTNNRQLNRDILTPHSAAEKRSKAWQEETPKDPKTTSVRKSVAEYITTNTDNSQHAKGSSKATSKPELSAQYEMNNRRKSTTVAKIPTRARVSAPKRKAGELNKPKESTPVAVTVANVGKIIAENPGLEGGIGGGWASKEGSAGSDKEREDKKARVEKEVTTNAVGMKPTSGALSAPLARGGEIPEWAIIINADSSSDATETEGLGLSAEQGANGGQQRDKDEDSAKGKNEEMGGDLDMKE